MLAAILQVRFLQNREDACHQGKEFLNRLLDRSRHQKTRSFLNIEYKMNIGIKCICQ